MADPAPRHLVVLGAGPKALFALEALAVRLADPVATPWPRITVVDPAAEPGTGAAYAHDQPSVLRLNVAASILDAPEGSRVLAYPDWAAAHEAEPRGETSPPRASVGRYLTARWSALATDLGARTELQHLRARALAVRPAGAGWEVELDGEHPRLRADELLVATGHGAGHEGALAARWDSPLPLRPAVLPASTMLSPAQVPPGARVALRGAALTFLDAALALTEGRGARFEEHPGEHGRLRHHRHPDEPAVLLPTARHGLLLDAKPDPGTPAATPDPRILAVGRHDLTALDPDRDDLPERLREVIARTATALLDPTGGADHARAVRTTLVTGTAPDTAPGTPGRAEAALRRSVEVALGHTAPGPAWALGRTWSALYPEVTALLRGSTLPAPAWGRIRTTAQVLERFAFGPPLLTARKLLAMVDSGAVDLAWLDAGVRIGPSGPAPLPPRSPAPDLVIDAVLPPPGLLGLTDPLARQLLAEGVVAVREGRRGAMVDTDGTAVDPLGRRREHLALIGRPTEDHVIGHDTLNRHLHHEIDRWAARIAAPAPTRGDRP